MLDSQLSPQRRLLLVAAIVLLLVGGPVLWRLLQAPAGVVVDLPAAMVEPPTGSSTAGAGTQGAPATVALQPPATVTVHVIGGVRVPGVVVLPAGSRVADAVAACGGPTEAGHGDINLARPLSDGEQLDVGAAGAASAAAGGATPPQAQTAGAVNLNTATPEQLDSLPGVGPALAGRIIAHRAAHGPFTSVEQLRDVPGIGDRRMAELADLVTAGP